MKKVYVAGCFDDYLEIRRIQEIIKLQGFEISYDWTIRAEKTINERNNNVSDTRTFDKLGEESKLDMNGVIEADWTIFVITKKDYVYRGTFCELGASITRDILNDKIGHTIILSGNEISYAKTLCFYHHPNVIHINTLDSALTKMTSMAY